VSNTPKTDAKAQFFGFNPDEGEEFVQADFARELERENAALLEALKRADLALGDLGIGRAAPVRVIARNALRKEAQP